MLCLGRDENGYPKDGVDIVPQAREPLKELITILEQSNKQVTKLKQQADLVKLLQQANDREKTLKHKVEHWYRKYNSIHTEYIALKYSDLWLACQKKQDSTRSGKTYTLCDSCCEGKQTTESLKRELEKERQQSIYWQECHETERIIRV